MNNLILLLVLFLPVSFVFLFTRIVGGRSQIDKIRDSVPTSLVGWVFLQSLKATQSWIQATQDNCKAGSEFVYKVTFYEQFQGVVGLRQIEGSEDFNLGYWLSPQAWGKGYATECSRTLLEHFDAMHSGKKIVSGYFLDNLASGRVLSKLGFVKTGENTVFCKGRNHSVAHIAVERNISN